MDGGVGDIVSLVVALFVFVITCVVGKKETWKGTKGFGCAFCQQVVSGVEGHPPLVEDNLKKLSVCGE